MKNWEGTTENHFAIKKKTYEHFKCDTFMHVYIAFATPHAHSLPDYCRLSGTCGFTPLHTIEIFAKVNYNGIRTFQSIEYKMV